MCSLDTDSLVAFGTRQTKKVKILYMVNYGRIFKIGGCMG